MTKTIRRALLSVTDKTGLVELGQFLDEKGVELLSTGGSARVLRDAGLPVKDVSDVTGFPEIMDGRVKTLHPNVHGGILAVRENADHQEAMKAHGIAPIDLVVVNLYAFENTVASQADYQTTVENIDIGGPAMIRAAAKNHEDVVIITDIEDYDALRAEMDSQGGATTQAFRRQQAEIAFARTAAYDAAVSGWFAKQLKIDTPRRVTRAAKQVQSLRYGENPHQEAAFYAPEGGKSGFGAFELHQGKPLSYNNLNDANAALKLIQEFADGPACAIIKHANPCGVAEADTLTQAYKNALACDPVSAFGGVLALNQELNAETATAITEIFTEVVIAPSVTEAAKDVFAKKKNLRLITLPFEAAQISTKWTDIAGGALLQTADQGADDAETFKVVTEKAPTSEQMADLLFAWKVAKHVKSNAIVYTKNGRTVGVGAGQMSRVDSARIAARKAKDMEEFNETGVAPTQGSVVASDAFFPFADGLLQAAEAGAVAVIQPGGSMRDDEVIKAANEAGLAMVFTGIRHFNH